MPNQSNIRKEISSRLKYRKWGFFIFCPEKIHNKLVFELIKMKLISLAEKEMKFMK